MADKIRLSIDTGQYRQPTQRDIKAAKQFILQRNESAWLLENRIDGLLVEAAQEIVTICYKYKVDPQKLIFSSDYNENMMREISEVMDRLEEDILDLIYEYALMATKDSKHKNLLAAWITSLGRGNRNLQETLDGYLFKTMKDIEAATAALMAAGTTLPNAITRIKTHIHSIYTMPEVKAAFKHADDFEATYIRTRGVMHGGVGLSNNGSTNVTNMAKTTLQMAWMRQQGTDFRERGAAGYYQLRGSLYPCDICDSEVGFHAGLQDIYTKPYPHPHCMCYRIPIYRI